MEIYELNWESRHPGSELFSGATFDRVFVESFFEGRQPGRLFVDDPERPAGALLCRTYDYLLAGEPAPALRQFIADAPAEADVFDTIHDLAAAKRTKTIRFYGFVPMSDAWRIALESIFGEHLETIGRRAFRFDPANVAVARDWPRRLPAGYAVRPIDAPLAERIDTECDDLIGLFWGGYERFGLEGFGAAVVTGSEIASVAYTISVSSREINIGVETNPAHRRRGLATIASQACIVQALDRGLTPTWDCDYFNVPSGLLAIAAGFREEPSFVELTFPNRGGPALSSGRWRSEPGEHAVIWRSTSP